MQCPINGQHTKEIDKLYPWNDGRVCHQTLSLWKGIVRLIKLEMRGRSILRCIQWWIIHRDKKGQSSMWFKHFVLIVMHGRPVRTSYVEIKHLRRNLERDLIWCKPIHLKSLSINLNNLSIFHRENIRSLLLY